MSKKISNDKYQKTFSYRLKQWFDGTKDPYLNNVEMQPQKEYEEAHAVVESRKREKEQLYERIYDIKHNSEIQFFNKLYRIFSMIFCIGLVLILLVGVSHLPAIGEADKPVNNEVSERYIESGLQETGAVNIVTGMILDYRAFDTLGESHVLFIATCTVLILLREDKKKKLT